MTENASGTKFRSDVEKLEYLKERFMSQIEENKTILKVGDFLKIIELQRKLAGSDDAQKKFWEIIEQIRREELKDDDDSQ
jgi:hypothetical protein